MYSLLGLALEEEAFEADYTKTVQEVFVNVGRHLLGYPNPKIGHELALLASVKHYEDDQSDGWPPWVPRWHREPPERTKQLESRRGTMYIMSNLPPSQKFNGGGPESRIDIPDQLNPYVIAVEG